MTAEWRYKQAHVTIEGDKRLINTIARNLMMAYSNEVTILSARAGDEADPDMLVLDITTQVQEPNE